MILSFVTELMQAAGAAWRQDLFSRRSGRRTGMARKHSPAWRGPLRRSGFTTAAIAGVLMAMHGYNHRTQTVIDFHRSRWWIWLVLTLVLVAGVAFHLHNTWISLNSIVR